MKSHDVNPLSSAQLLHNQNFVLNMHSLQKVVFIYKIIKYLSFLNKNNAIFNIQSKIMNDPNLIFLK